MKDHGDCTKVSDESYVVRIRQSDPILTQFLTFIHEMLHVAIYVYFPSLDPRREHKFISAIERSVKRHFRKYWSGK